MSVTTAGSETAPAGPVSAAGAPARAERRQVSGLVRAGVIAGFSLGAGAGHVDVLAAGLQRVWSGRLVFTPEWFWWAAPWVNGVLAVVATLGVLALLRGPLRRLQPAACYAVPLTLAAAGVLLVVPGLHRAALVALAVGVGVRGGGFLAARARVVNRLLAWSLVPLLLVGPLLFTLLFGLPARAAGVPTGAARSGMPNILVIVLDTVRAIELSLYGGRDGTSPVIDRVGDGGVVFGRASSTAPWTLPSHASLFTGYWPHQLDASLLTPLRRDVPTLAEQLAALGYRTAGFSANVEYASAETGLARGFSHYQDHRWSLRGLVHLTRLSRLVARNAALLAPAPADLPGRVDAALINRRFLRWLGTQPADAPVFAFLNYYDAHAPYYPPEPQWTRFVGAVPRRPLDNPHHLADDSALVALQRRAYAGAINHIDGQLGMLLDSLAAAGRLDNTLIVITSDHGEEFAEHGVLGHGNTLYMQSVHVPLIIAWPGHVPAACRVEEPVSIRDVPATIMGLIGADHPFPGRSLADHWRGGTPHPVAVFTHTQRGINQPAHLPASRGPLYGVEVSPYRLIVENDPVALQLFRHTDDPGERTDLAADPARAPVLAALLDSLAHAGLPVAVPRPPASAAPGPVTTHALSAHCPGR